MNRAVFALLTALTIAGCDSASQPAAPPAVTAISMEQYECFWGTCPHYRIALRNDGSAVYTGIAVVQKSGTVALHPGTDSFRSVARELERIGFFQLQPTYRSQADGCASILSDQSAVTFSATRGGKTKTIFLSYGCQGLDAAEDLAELARLVDRQAGLAPLLGRGSPL